MFKRKTIDTQFEPEINLNRLGLESAYAPTHKKTATDIRLDSIRSGIQKIYDICMPFSRDPLQIAIKEADEINSAYLRAQQSQVEKDEDMSQYLGI